MDPEERIEAAGRAIRTGGLVVYPTETVYGLGADALDPTAIERVFEAKRRPRENPLSFAVPSPGAAREYLRADDVTLACMDRFLPGPVTVVCEKAAAVPDVLTGGRDRVGVRVPDHELARSFLRAADRPVTATSANVSGAGSVTRPDGLDARIRERAAAVLDGGETPGLESTVVDPGRGVIHRRGANAEAVAEWLESRGAA